MAIRKHGLRWTGDMEPC